MALVHRIILKHRTDSPLNQDQFYIRDQIVLTGCECLIIPHSQISDENKCVCL